MTGKVTKRSDDFFCLNLLDLFLSLVLFQSEGRHTTVYMNLVFIEYNRHEYYTIIMMLIFQIK